MVLASLVLFSLNRETLLQNPYSIWGHPLFKAPWKMFYLVLFKIYFLYLFLAVLGLCCDVQAFSSCGEWGILCCEAQASHCGGFSCFRAWGSRSVTSVVVAQGLSCILAFRIFLEQGSNPFPILADRFFTTGPSGKSLCLVLAGLTGPQSWVKG